MTAYLWLLQIKSICAAVVFINKATTSINSVAKAQNQLQKKRRLKPTIININLCCVIFGVFVIQSDREDSIANLYSYYDSKPQSTYKIYN